MSFANGICLCDIVYVIGAPPVHITNPIIIEDETNKKSHRRSTSLPVALPASGDSEEPPQNLKISQDRKKNGSQKSKNKGKEDKENEEHQGICLSGFSQLQLNFCLRKKITRMESRNQMKLHLQR